MRKKSEAILDFVLAFIGIAILGLGISRIWVWFDVNYVGRQLSYQKGRLYAGSPKKFTEAATAAGSPFAGTVGNYADPVGTAASVTCPTCAHRPLDLTEKWVFQGVTEEKYRIGTGLTGVTGALNAADCEVVCSGKSACGSIALKEDCTRMVDDLDSNGMCREGAFELVWFTGMDGKRTQKQQCRQVCAKVRDETKLDDAGNFNTKCPCYVVCDCLRRNEMTMIGLGRQIAQLCGVDAVQVTRHETTDKIVFSTINAQYKLEDGKVVFTGCGGDATEVDSCGNVTASNGCVGCESDPEGQEDEVAALYREINARLGLTSADIDAAGDWKGQACQLCDNADGMEESAEGCCDPWDMCWWFTWGKACDPLKEAAKMLRLTANQVVAEGVKLQKELYTINKCCSEDKQPDQEACFKGEEAAGPCETPDLTSQINQIRGKISYRDPDTCKVVPVIPAPVHNGCRVFSEADFVRYSRNGSGALGQIDWACRFMQDINEVMESCHGSFRSLQCGEDTQGHDAPHRPGGCVQCLHKDMYALAREHDCTVCDALRGGVSVPFKWWDIERFDRGTGVGYLRGVPNPEIRWGYYGCMNSCTQSEIPQMLKTKLKGGYSLFLLKCTDDPVISAGLSPADKQF